MEYILVLGWLALTAIIGRMGGMHHKEKVLGKERRTATWVYALLMVGPLILWATFRNRFFGDTFMYIRMFQSLPVSMEGKWMYLKSIEKDPGFYGFAVLLSTIIGKHFRYFLLTIAMIQGLALAKTYRKYSEDYWFAIFVFVASTDIYSWMYNGIRQFTAVAITFAAADWIFRRKYIRAVLAVLFASLFHKSALMMLPIIFIVQGRPWNWKTLLVIAGTLFAMTFSGVFTNVLDDALSGTQYKNVVSDWTSWGDDGTNPIRVIVYAVPTIISLFCRKKIYREKDRVLNVACNMSIVSTALYMISMVTSGIFVGRLPIYCSLYANGILLPWELKHVLGRQIRTIAIACYVLFFFVQMHFVWGVL